MSVGAVLVAVRAQRHFSAGAWVIWVGIALATVWLAVRSWRKVRAAVADERRRASPVDRVQRGVTARTVQQGSHPRPCGILPAMPEEPATPDLVELVRRAFAAANRRDLERGGQRLRRGCDLRRQGVGGPLRRDGLPSAASLRAGLARTTGWSTGLEEVARTSAMGVVFARGNVRERSPRLAAAVTFDSA